MQVLDVSVSIYIYMSECLLFVLLDFETWNNCNIYVNILDPDYVAGLQGI
jgi:hypothetical protein